MALKSDNTDAAALTQQLNLAKQLYTNAPGLLEGFIIDGAAAALGAQVAEQTGLTFFGSSDKLQDVSAWLNAKPNACLQPNSVTT